MDTTQTPPPAPIIVTNPDPDDIAGHIDFALMNCFAASHLMWVRRTGPNSIQVKCDPCQHVYRADVTGMEVLPGG